MASYSLTTTTEQEALLQWIVAQYNREHDSNLTASQYIALRFPQLLAPFQAAFVEYIQKAVATSFSAADPAVQAQVRALLGLS